MLKKKKVTPIQKVEETILNLIYEASVILIKDADKHSTK